MFGLYLLEKMGKCDGKYSPKRIICIVWISHLHSHVPHAIHACVKFLWFGHDCVCVCAWVCTYMWVQVTLSVGVLACTFVCAIHIVCVHHMLSNVNLWVMVNLSFWRTGVFEWICSYKKSYNAHPITNSRSISRKCWCCCRWSYQCMSSLVKYLLPY